MLIPFDPAWRVACSQCEHLSVAVWSAPQQSVAGVSWHCKVPCEGLGIHGGDERSCSHMRAPGMPCGPDAKLKKDKATPKPARGHIRTDWHS